MIMPLKNKRVLVTGAEGFIGRRLCKSLFDKEAKLFGISRCVTESKYLTEQYEVDISNAPAIKKIINSVQPEYVVHLAASKNRGVDGAAFREGYGTNLIGSLNVIDACQSIPVLAKFVSLGTTDEYGKLQVPFKESYKEAPNSAYGASKLAVTDLLRALSRSNGFPSVILRPTIVYGPGQDSSMFLPALVRALVENKNFDMSLGEQTRDFVYIDDLVEAIIMALVAPVFCGDVINISSGRPIRIDALAKMTAAMLGNDAYKRLRLGSIEYRTGDVMQYWASNELAKASLGWAPVVPLEDGIERTVNYFKSLARVN